MVAETAADVFKHFEREIAQKCGYGHGGHCFTNHVAMIMGGDVPTNQNWMDWGSLVRLPMTRKVHPNRPSDNQISWPFAPKGVSFPGASAGKFSIASNEPVRNLFMVVHSRFFSQSNQA